jgi:hypothetical protein
LPESRESAEARGNWFANKLSEKSLYVVDSTEALLQGNTPPPIFGKRGYKLLKTNDGSD